MKQESKYISQQQAAALLGVSARTLRAYIASGRLPASRIKGTRTVRILRTDVDDLLVPIPTTGGDAA